MTHTEIAEVLSAERDHARSLVLPTREWREVGAAAFGAQAPRLTEADILEAVALMSIMDGWMNPVEYLMREGSFTRPGAKAALAEIGRRAQMPL